MRKFTAFTFLFALTFTTAVWSVNVHAQGVMRIAAVVNDDIISALDLAQRVRLTIATTRIPDSPDVRQRLARNLLDTMIDERLKMQEAERAEVKVSQEQIEAGLRSFALSQQIKPEFLDNFLKQIGVDREIIEDQANAEIGWSIALARSSGSRISVSEKEIDDALTEKKANHGKPEYLISEIYIPVEVNAQDAAAKQMAEALLVHIQNGSPFPSLAREFSQGATAQEGGALGWVQSSHLDPELQKILPLIPERSISKPIRTAAGYHIISLHEKRISGAEENDELFNIAQVVLPVGVDAPAETWAEKNNLARTLAHQANSCDNVVELGNKLEGAQAGLLNNIKLSQMPGDIKQTLQGLNKNQITTLEQKKGAVLVLMVCERTALPSTPEITVRNEVKQQLRVEKINRESRHQLKQLRRNAFVDIRL